MITTGQFLLVVSLIISGNLDAQAQSPEPIENFDYEGCYRDLYISDVDGDSLVKEDEYFGFVRRLSLRVCPDGSQWPTFLNPSHREAFNAIACFCMQV